MRSCFECQNPSWPKYLHHVIIPQALIRLGFDREWVIERIAARPCTLGLYETRSSGTPFFTKRISDDHFGVLSIVLPSRNSGTTFRLKSRDEVFEFGTDDGQTEWKSYYVAAGAGAEEYMVGVREGHQLVVTYELLYDRANGAQSISRRMSEPTSMLQEVITKWEANLRASERQCPFLLAGRLETDYDNNHLGFDKLKGLDRTRIRHLRQACLGTDFQICLANLHRTVEGEPWSDNDLTETELVLPKVIRANGDRGKAEVVGTQLHFDLAWMLDGKDDIYGDRDGDSESEEEGWSDEVTIRTLRYRDTVSLTSCWSQIHLLGGDKNTETRLHMCQGGIVSLILSPACLGILFSSR